MPSEIVIHASTRARLPVLLLWLSTGGLLLVIPIHGHLPIVLAWTLTLFWSWRTTPGLGGPELRLWQEAGRWYLRLGEGASRPLVALRPFWVSVGLVSAELTTPAGKVTLVAPADAVDPGTHRHLRCLLIGGLPHRKADQSVTTRGT